MRSGAVLGSGGISQWPLWEPNGMTGEVRKRTVLVPGFVELDSLHDPADAYKCDIPSQL